MSRTTANILLLCATIIWGTAFVTQKTGMDHIGPFTFSFSRFFFGMIIVFFPAILIEKKSIIKILSNKKLSFLFIFTGFALFLGMGLQQYSLLQSQISNSAFFSTLYVRNKGLAQSFLLRRQFGMTNQKGQN